MGLQPRSLQAQTDASQAQPGAPSALSVRNLDDTQFVDQQSPENLDITQSVDQHDPMNVHTAGKSHQVEGPQESLTDAGGEDTPASKQQDYCHANNASPELQPPCQSHSVSLFTGTMRAVYGLFAKGVRPRPSF
jgi:hypothetical protein